TAANRDIVGASTKLNKPISVTLDNTGDLVVSNQGGSITVYANAATASGNQAPAGTVTGATTTLVTPAQVIRNPVGTSNEVYVADTTGNEVAVFSGISTANGAPAPARKIAGPTTTLTGTSARGVALDTTR
ncbi:MAG TPA: hypothetical protein VE783_08140, partial [Candidatus Limnocylindrales bacterium]|nr:hypothetical protein [Candidatus Limnocylindrales bacterium]